MAQLPQIDSLRRPNAAASAASKPRRFPWLPCLNHFGIADKLAVGEVTNMYVIVQKQLEAGVVVRP